MMEEDKIEFINFIDNQPISVIDNTWNYFALSKDCGYFFVNIDK